VELKNGKKFLGEKEFSAYQLVSKFGIKKMSLQPTPKANPAALEAIKEADLIVIGPGNLYSSIVPNFLVPGIGKAVARSKAKKIYVANLMNRHGHTDDFTVLDYVRTLEKFIGKKRVFDVVIYNTKRPAQSLIRKYADEGEPVKPGLDPRGSGYQVIGADLLAESIAKTAKKDLIRRTLIRHDPEKVARIISTL